MNKLSDKSTGALKSPTVLEKVAGSPFTGAGAGIVGVLAGDFAGLLPSLFDTLSRGRQIVRIEDALRSLDMQLRELGDSVISMSDDQYKVVTDAVAAMYRTIEADKLRILRRAAVGAAQSPDIVQGAATPLGRLLRDLSVAEVEFLVKYAGATGFMISEPIGADVAGRVFVSQGSSEEGVMGGLISLGLLYARSSTWDAAMYEWSPLAGKVVALLRANENVGRLQASS